MASLLAGLLALFAILGTGSKAHAALITLQFTATNFPPTFAGTPAPFPTIGGSIVYDAADVASPILSLTSISLTIGSHTYTVGELGFITQPNAISTSSIIGGTLRGVGGVSSFTNDFSLQFDRSPVPGIGANFVYAVTGTFGIWRSTTFTNFSLSSAPIAVPEPGGLILFAVGLAGLALMSRRRRRAWQDKAP